MAYQVIARKYRPQRFADVVGQEHVTQTLANAIAQNRIAHAYLFCGPRGTGKTTVARIFAKCLNATGGPKVDFAEDDTRCQEITEGRSIDVLEIDGASNNGVEQVRELRETVKYAPASSKFKIYIIDEVHMLSTAAFNALLKTLEEPPEHVKFLFATTDPEKVLPTILSRCQRFDLRRIPVSLITEHLGYIAKQENVNIDAEALHAIARGADGGMRDAESALDQLISFCGEKIVESDVLSMFGLTARSQVIALAAAVLNGDAEGALRELNALAKHGKDLGRLLSDLLNHFRNLLIYQVSKGDLKLLEVSETEGASLKEQSAAVSGETLTRIMEVLTEAEGRLRDAASKKIFIEVALLKAIQARNAVSIDSVLKQLQQLRSEGGGPTAPALISAQTTTPTPIQRPVETPRPAAVAPAVSEPTPTPAPAPKATVSSPPPAPTPVTVQVAPPVQDQAPAPSSGEVDLHALWAALLDAVGRASPFTRGYLIEAHPVSLTKNVFTIGFAPEFSDHIDLVNNAKTNGVLQTKLGEFGHPNTQVKFIKAEPPASWSEARASLQAAAPASPPSPAPSTAAPSPAKANGSSGLAAAGAQPKRDKPVPITLNAEEFKNDPLIQKALEVFKGRIIEVRA
ncbi:MAG: DNA polymerase III subunit gamma/tau [Verrucomicrobia bacterium]|nr:DNA polymerase III subunit gamma/tau [Verrucomicrobiota bacterium]